MQDQTPSRNTRWLVARASTALVIAASAAGCTTERNPRFCGDGICVDPAYPFCDIDGMFGELRQQCVAVECAPDAFVACRGDDELRCNATGTNYDVTRCELGCDPAAGCRVREIDPSNGLAQYLDLVPDPPDLDLENGSIDTSAGTITTQSGGSLVLPNFGAPNGGGPPIRVFIANNVRLKNVSAYSTIDPDRVSGPALAIVARGQIVIEGRLTVLGTAGGVKAADCTGGIGRYYQTYWSVASGGGGHATAGARGGDIGSRIGGAGGATAGADDLVPLRGGCPSGGIEDTETGTIFPFGMAGGGAVQLSSRVAIEVRGVIDVRGKYGDYEASPGSTAVYGGGAGGGILLEAPMVSLGGGARLIAKGGGGGTLGPSILDDDTGSPSLGMTCPGACPDGGNGAAPGLAATPGESSPATTGSDLFTGGGGGGMGYVRINTADGSYLRSSTAVEAAIVTSGILRTREQPARR